MASIHPAQGVGKWAQWPVARAALGLKPKGRVCQFPLSAHEMLSLRTEPQDHPLRGRDLPPWPGCCSLDSQGKGLRPWSSPGGQLREALAGSGVPFGSTFPFLSRLSGSILKNQEDTFAAELHRLKQQPLFNLVDFESVVDWIRSTVAEVSCSAR